ncbi:hypothetical protein [Methylobacterium sp. SD21]|uniref:hypothetical protein n=1 Tax=Methylobacterium litchii TaxID=3138810 RepID=UPI00313C1C1A
MPRRSPIAPDAREAILDGWAAGKTARELAAQVGTDARRAFCVIMNARRRGDPRATLRNPGAAWKPEPVVYPSSQAYLDAALARVRERQAVWERTEMGIRMAAIAVPPPDER